MLNALNKIIVVLGLLILIMSIALLWSKAKTAGAFASNNLHQDVLVIQASDTDPIESEDDDDEWEA